MPESAARPPKPSWRESIARYQRPSLHRSVWQLVNSLVPFFVLWGLMAWTVNISVWITLALALPAAGFSVRIFIIFHDCGHGSFFKSRRANNFWGFLTGLLMFTPYQQWRYDHAVHHATAGGLDRRGKGDIWTLTIEEYLALPRMKRLAYRLVRNPLVLFLVAPMYLFLIHYRFPTKNAGRRERRSVLWTNLALLGMFLVLVLTLGLRTVLWVQLPISIIATTAGVWLFYVQHQFEGVSWERKPDWDFVAAALHGSSFYKLPKVLQWFSGNIGFHHIHHLSPVIPNYNLERCHRAEPRFREVKAVTLWGSFKSLSYRLWDEQRGRLVGYRAMRSVRAQRNPR